jgi:arabinogalactan oligomer/maltooligosaccharide transport system substrate-binding protein
MIRFRISLCLVVLCSVLSGCVPPWAAAPTPTPPPPTPTEQATSIPNTPPPTAEPEVTLLPASTPLPEELALWVALDTPFSEQLQQIIAEVNVQHRLAIMVTIKTTDALQADLQAALAAHLPLPDLIMASQDDLGILARQQFIQPAPDGLDMMSVVPALLDGASMDGQRWGTPIAANGSLYLLYNRKLVGQPPASTDGLIVAARDQVTGGRFGITAGWAEPRWLAAWLAGSGGSVLDGSGEPNLNTPAMETALNVVKALRGAGVPPPSTYGAGATMFREGKIAFAIDGDWAIKSYQNYTETLDLGIAPMPRVSATDIPAAGPLSGSYLLYSASLSGTRLEQATNLAKALLEPDTQVRLAQELGWIPAIRAVSADERLHDLPAITMAQIDQASGLPPSEALRCAYRAMEIIQPLVILEEVKVEDAGRLMQDRALKCLAGE